MCGDAGILKMAPAEARKRLGIPAKGFLVSVFDVATVDDEWRKKFEGGPVAIDMDFAQAFFSGLITLLQALPELSIILKLKRKIGSRYRAFPPALLEIVSASNDYLRNKRVWLVDVNCDPFLPIAAGDAAIGMPGTSPVLVARAAGRPGVYFDPLGIVGNTMEPELRMLCVRQLESLIEQVTAWTKNGTALPAPPLARLDSRPTWPNDRILFAR